MGEYINNMPIPELINELDSYMVSLGYTASTLRHHRQAWNALKNLALAEGATHFSKELGFKLLREHYKIDPYESNLSEYKSVVRRSVMLLLEFQISGSIAKRLPKGEYEFPAGFKTAGDQFMEYMTESNLAPGTLYNYRMLIFRATLFFVNHKASDFKSLNNDVINLYLKTFAGYSKAYIATNVQVLSKFLIFANEHGYTDKVFKFPAVTVFKDRRVSEYYTAEEVSKILSSIDRGNALGKRNYAMVLLGARYGLRISDILSLKLNELDFENNRISIIQQKTGNPLELDMLPDVGWALIDYLKNGRPYVDCDNVFLCHTHPYKAFTRGVTMQSMLRQYALSAGIWKAGSEKRCSFHMLRYSLASDLIQQGVSLTTISGILGHSELNVTTLYTQLDVPQLKACALEVPV
ncbi:site-specific integrase [Ruminococcus albus]|uniref:Site-specific recombinase XerD n=1 Tax=Ruminococcus albus TaxID=1264 RepID=A0A1I1M2U9_RUMAL|nr:site-specific integrase [Ruminococcus albus]SFC79694.1 Site-specific recombinase XerD [Ruminococcus albus]